MISSSHDDGTEGEGGSLEAITHLETLGRAYGSSPGDEVSVKKRGEEGVTKGIRAEEGGSRRIRGVEVDKEELVYVT